jgi:hypothetical protein
MLKWLVQEACRKVAKQEVLEEDLINMRPEKVRHQEDKDRGKARREYFFFLFFLFQSFNSCLRYKKKRMQPKLWRQKTPVSLSILTTRTKESLT